MGFLDKAKAAASDLAAKADSALNSSGAGGPKPPGAGDVAPDAVGRAAGWAWRSEMIWARTEIAISAGVRAPMSSPAGVCS